MKYYVVADVHGYYTELRLALAKAGYDADTEPHKLIILGDLFDRGTEAADVQSFVLEKLASEEIILIRGNHEDLYASLVTEDRGIRYRHHVLNGTFDTALQLTGYDSIAAQLHSYEFAAAGRCTPYYETILPAMVDYYETENYVFVHGWIPGDYSRNAYSYYSDWRNAECVEWEKARWYNGMDAIRTTAEIKTIVCGHWHTSYGHSKYENKGSEFGNDADFSPYYASGIIALDACTSQSHMVNCIVIEDGAVEENE